MPCGMAERVTGIECPWWKAERPVISQDAAYALLEAAEDVVKCCLHGPDGVTEKKAFYKAIADAKRQPDADE